MSLKHNQKSFICYGKYIFSKVKFRVILKYFCENLKTKKITKIGRIYQKKD